MGQPIITYSQLSGGGGGAPCDYYDPNLLYNESGFTIQAGEEFLLLISGVAYRLEDEAIYHLDCKDDDDGTFFLSSTLTDRQLCLLIRNRSPIRSYHVARKTSLAWVLDLPRITSKLCHVAITEMAKTRIKTGFAAAYAQNTQYPPPSATTTADC